MQIIIYIALFQSLLPLVYYWFVKEKITYDQSKPILPFIYLCFVASTYEIIFTFIMYVSSTFWFYVYDFLAFFTIQYFFYFILNKKNKLMVWVSSILYFFLFFYFIFHHTKENFLNSISYLGVFTTTIIIYYAIWWFKNTFTERVYASLTQNPIFYFVSGFLLYYTGTIVLYLMANSIYLNQREFINYYWMVNVIFNIIHKALLMIGIWKLQKQLTK